MEAFLLGQAGAVLPAQYTACCGLGLRGKCLSGGKSHQEFFDHRPAHGFLSVGVGSKRVGNNNGKVNKLNGVQRQGTAGSEVYYVCFLNAVCEKLIRPPHVPTGDRSWFLSLEHQNFSSDRKGLQAVDKWVFLVGAGR